MMVTAYAKKLRDPRWQKKSAEIKTRAGWACEDCSDSTAMLAVHHKTYEAGREPWDYPDANFVCCCERCHAEREAVAKASRLVFQEISPAAALPFLRAIMAHPAPHEMLLLAFMVYMQADAQTAKEPERA